MSSPIQRRVGQVFFPVRDVAAAIRWYAAVLGFETDVTSHDGTIYDIPTDGQTPKALGVRITSDVEDVGSVVVFVQFEDPDGNALMVCQGA
ncbi:hypothetical protein ASE25_08765 [Terrabacter sp. Root85]|uniref:VOC family protein n=1 Tax=Terrabacter sp. Root85 TaxID=1736603 RepID=UPI0006F7F3EA|nr:VOC family protein [Terrabacter sp. Root85]KRC89649.1 hypothetical protein ASE25_08765 [Terrabacter sp. Root85]